MKNVSVLCLAALVWTASNAAAQVSGEEEDLFAPVPMYALPDAATLRARVLDAMPGVPLRIEARLQAKQPSGTIETEAHAEVVLEPVGDVLQATYRVTDAFGGEEERLEIRRERHGGPVSTIFYSGEPAVRVEDPDLYARVRGTDLTWIDLSLSFLWWEGGETVGRERLRGRTCYVVDTPAPGGGEDHGYARVKLWLDAKVDVLLKAEAFDRDGAMVRRLLVDSFKKIDEVWFIKDIDIYTLPARHKTTLRVDTVKIIGEAEAPPATGDEG